MDEHQISDLSMNCASPNIREAQAESLNMLPKKPQTRYEESYRRFMDGGCFLI